MRRLPIRLRVTLAFAAALAVVLAAAGTFVYLRFEDELMRTVDAGLRTHAAEVPSARWSPGGLGTDRPGIEQDESFALVLSSDGEVVDATPGAPDPRLSAAELRDAPLFLEREEGTPDGEPARLLVVRAARGVAVAGPDPNEFVVAGVALDDQEEALATLLVLGGAGLLAALLLGSAAGYWAAGIALRPVEAMRAEADAITDAPDRRLPVPPADDEIGRLGATLNAMLGRLQAAAAKERRFVADASHELRTPLAILKSEIDVALARERPADELRDALASAGEEADRLTRLAQDLLLLARADEGELAIAPERLRVRELLDGVAARSRGRGEISVAAPEDLTVEADRERLLQVLTNLLDNALRHGRGAVELSADDGDGKVRIAVRDHGPGFPPDFAGRAFERFARGDAGRGGDGAGLGLAIVDAVARAHGGSAAVAPAEPGARVTVTLPASSIHHRRAAP